MRLFPLTLLLLSAASQATSPVGIYRLRQDAEAALRGKVQESVLNNWSAGKFQALDDTLDKWCTGNDRMRDGQWNLIWFGGELQSIFRSQQNWAEDLQRLEIYKQQRPNSRAARFATALYWQNYAWAARGPGFANTVSPEGFELFHQRLAKAKAELDAIPAAQRNCPAFAALEVDLSLEMGEPLAKTRALFDQAIKLWPQYQQLYFSMARRYEPKWGGSPQAYHRFALEATKLAQGFEGKGMYARLFWLIDDSRNGIPAQQGARYPDWKLLRTGLEDLDKAYPKSFHNLNHYASVICRSNESELYRTLRTRIGELPDPDMFDNVSLDACDYRHKWTEPGKS